MFHFSIVGSLSFRIYFIWSGRELDLTLWETYANQFMAHTSENTTGAPKTIIITHVMCQKSSSMPSYYKFVFFLKHVQLLYGFNFWFFPLAQPLESFIFLMLALDQNCLLIMIIHRSHHSKKSMFILCTNFIS